MTNAQFTTAIQAFDAAINSLRLATVRGIVLPTDRQALDRLYMQIKDTLGIESPPGENATAHELLEWLVPALRAFRAEQQRRRATVTPGSRPMGTAISPRH